MSTTTETAAITVTVKESDKIEVRQGCEYAAWYTLWKVLPGTYAVERKIGKFWPDKDLPIYVAKVDAEVIEDYYASHYGGMPVSEYDIHQNAGKRGHVYLYSNPAQLLKHEAVEIPEEEYDRLLDEGLVCTMERANNSLRCIKTNNGDIEQLEWVGGHAESLAKYARLYEEFFYTKARREHNRKCQAEGRRGWTDPRETHARKDNRTWIGQA